jgi:hypothetical protein
MCLIEELLLLLLLPAASVLKLPIWKKKGLLLHMHCGTEERERDL